MTDLDAIRRRCDAADESAVVAAAEAWAARAESVGMTEGDTRKYYINLMEKAEDHFRATLSAALSARDNAIDGLAKALEECAASGDVRDVAADFYANATPKEARKRALRKYAVPQEMADIADETDISPGNYRPPSPPVAREVDAVETAAQAWADRAVAVHAGERPCDVSDYRDAFLFALDQLLAHSQAAVARERAERATVAKADWNTQPGGRIAAAIEARGQKEGGE